MSEPKFKIGDEVFVTGFDDPGRDCQEGLIILYGGKINVVTMRQRYISYGITTSYEFGGATHHQHFTVGENSVCATRNEALECCAEYWESRSTDCLRRAARAREQA